MSKMKIFYTIIDDFPPYRVDIAELFGVSLTAMGVDIEWFMRRYKSGQCGSEDFKGQTVHLPFFVARSGTFWKIINKLSLWAYDILQLTYCLGKKIDLIQVRDKYIGAVYGLIIARIKSVPFVYWCSYPYPEHVMGNGLSSKGIKKIIFFLQGWLAKIILYHVVMSLSDHVFVQSEQMKRDIHAYGVPLDKMTAIPMGVPQKILDWVAATSVAEKSGTIVYLGTLAEVRQLHVLVEAFAKTYARFSFARLIFVGEGDKPEDREALERLVQQLGIACAVEFTGFIPMEQAWEITASAQVCVSPFYPTLVLNSASPTKLNEYMALGRPVVCNDHPEQSATIKASGAGLCVPWGVDTFADAMIWLLEHPDEARKMGAKGPDWVAKHRVYDRIAETVWNKYQDILKVNA